MIDIERAAQIMADEAQRQGMTADDLWNRWMNRMDEIPMQVFETTIDVTLRACEIIDESQEGRRCIFPVTGTG